MVATGRLALQGKLRICSRISKGSLNGFAQAGRITIGDNLKSGGHACKKNGSPPDLPLTTEGGVRTAGRVSTLRYERQLPSCVRMCSCDTYIALWCRCLVKSGGGST